MKSFFSIPVMALATTLLSSCASTDLPQGSFKASVKMTSSNGVLHTCTGKYAYLFAPDKRTNRAMNEIFGSNVTGISDIYSHWQMLQKNFYQFTKHQASRGEILGKEKVHAEYYVKCDENGDAIFNNIKDGDYYLIVPFIWDTKPESKGRSRYSVFSPSENIEMEIELPSDLDGGVYMRNVKTDFDKTHSIILQLEN